MFTYPVVLADLGLRKGLLAFWKMDETGTSPPRLDATGDSGHTLNNFGGGTQSDRDVILGRAPDFRGVTGQGMGTTSNDFRFYADGNKTFSFSYWVYHDNSGSYEHLGRGRHLQVVTQEWKVHRQGGNLETVFGNAAKTTVGDTIPDTTWTHCVTTYDFATGAIQLIVNDGTPVTDTYAPGVPASGGTEPAFYVGGQSAGGASIDGAIDEVGVWLRVLTAEEITKLYNGGIGITYEDL